MKLFNNQAVKFLLIGVLNTAIGTTVMFVAYNVFALGYDVSSALNYIIGSIVSFFLNKYFTFQNKTKSVKQVIYFIVNITICYFVAYQSAKFTISNLLSGYSISVIDNVSMLLGMVLFVVLNFFGQKYIVFKEKVSV